MVANFRLSTFEKNNSTEDAQENKIFQFNALIQEFCECYQPCQ